MSSEIWKGANIMGRFRQSIENQRNERVARIEAALGDGRTICDRCGATLATYADVCSAGIAEPCPGFVAVENAGKLPIDRIVDELYR